jgi:hypothetical protein
MKTRRSKIKKLSYCRANQPWNTKEKRAIKIKMQQDTAVIEEKFFTEQPLLK